MASEIRGVSDWTPVIRAAQNLRTVRVWMQQLADALEGAVRPDAAAIFLCQLGNVLEASYAMAPRAYEPVAHALVERVLPNIRAAGVETPGALFAGLSNDEEQPLRVQIRSELLVPAGFRGMLGGFLRSRDGMIAGCVAVFCRRSEDERLAEIGMQLTQLRSAVEETLRNAIDVAQLAGARLPKISADALSRREHEIASLAVKGFSDLNIAERLEISEGTVGRHLHNIYRKLGVSSRLELADVLYVG